MYPVALMMPFEPTPPSTATILLMPPANAVAGQPVPPAPPVACKLEALNVVVPPAVPGLLPAVPPAPPAPTV